MEGGTPHVGFANTRWRILWVVIKRGGCGILWAGAMRAEHPTVQGTFLPNKNCPSQMPTVPRVGTLWLRMSLGDEVAV